ncbi:arabinan endo-1,5-alpha-L-arabinosidase [Virgisporangium aliadipatigenens]|uniref:Arabinan endo-1,5-alpha-L-arabinosidase n=1 Tax=Virgisporangium aliadipatigenens TaxID=741659 RepID=A0A8J4DUJ6_9ACTN|nr:arabinan endo-1,5-alpha-L-arabinosidase [Virgisporangium aliadipatigenens]GIJ50889.1 arabinan endo-1,5-alpha-L-arabinosidase [Virgisporangium aliadipatigenens]
MSRSFGRRAAAVLAVASATVVLAAVGATAATYPNPGTVSGNVSVHDPSMAKVNGTYYVLDSHNGLEIRTSTDRTAWRLAGSVFPNGAPAEVADYTGGDRKNLWAPDVSYRNGKFYVYYSASTFGSNKSAIFLATSATGAPGSYTQVGKVIETGTSSNYNAIDPNLVVDPNGNWWLALGSFWSGIKLISINPSTGLRNGSSIHSLATRTANSGSVEAPYIVYRSGYYYLFTSWDFCCRGTSSTYRTMVGRSTSITGPYVDRNGVALTAGGGSEVVASHDAIYGPGCPSVMFDSDGTVMAYHYYTANDSRLGINLVSWSGGWPALY